jgi:hypothetical protein
MEMKKTIVITYSVPKKVENGPPSTATRMDPQPLTEVEGAFGSDLAKANAREALEEAGFTVRSLNFSKGEILAYVDEDKVVKRKPRSATPRRRK